MVESVVYADIDIGGRVVRMGWKWGGLMGEFPYIQVSSISLKSFGLVWLTDQSQSSTYTPTPEPSSGSTSIDIPRSPSRSIFSLRNAKIKSSARGEELGGSSTMGSQPTGGEPGGEIRKFFSIGGGRRWKGSNSSVGEGCAIVVGSARYTRNTRGWIMDGVFTVNPSQASLAASASASL